MEDEDEKGGRGGREKRGNWCRLSEKEHLLVIAEKIPNFAVSSNGGFNRQKYSTDFHQSINKCVNVH